MKTPKEWLASLTSADSLGPNLYRNKNAVACVDESDIAEIQRDALTHAYELAGKYLQSMGSKQGMEMAALIYRDIQDEADKLQDSP